MSKENTAVFIGHNECYGVTSEQIKEAIVSLIDKGVTEFLSGGQGGFDRLCGRCVYEVKKQYPNINNYLVIPYLSFNVYNQELFDSIIYPDGFEKYNFTSKPPFLQETNLWWRTQTTLYAMLITDGAEPQRLMKERRKKA